MVELTARLNVEQIVGLTILSLVAFGVVTLVRYAYRFWVHTFIRREQDGVRNRDC